MQNKDNEDAFREMTSGELDPFSAAFGASHCDPSAADRRRDESSRVVKPNVATRR